MRAGLPPAETGTKKGAWRVVGIDVDEGEEGEGADEERVGEERGGHTMKGWLAWWWSGTIEGRGKGMKEPTPPGDDGDGRIAVVVDVEGSTFILMFLWTTLVTLVAIGAEELVDGEVGLELSAFLPKASFISMRPSSVARSSSRLGDEGSVRDIELLLTRGGRGTRSSGFCTTGKRQISIFFCGTLGSWPSPVLSLSSSQQFVAFTLASLSSSLFASLFVLFNVGGGLEERGR
jgi:hypothetical protein